MRLRALWALALAGLLAAAPAFADKKSDAAKRDLDALRARIARLAAEQRADEGKRGEAGAQLRAADTEVDRAARALRATESRLAAEQAELVKLQAQAATLEAGLAARRNAVGEIGRRTR